MESQDGEGESDDAFEANTVPEKEPESLKKPVTFELPSYLFVSSHNVNPKICLDPDNIDDVIEDAYNGKKLLVPLEMKSITSPNPANTKTSTSNSNFPPKPSMKQETMKKKSSIQPSVGKKPRKRRKTELSHPMNLEDDIAESQDTPPMKSPPSVKKEVDNGATSNYFNPRKMMKQPTYLEILQSIKQKQKREEFEDRIPSSDSDGFSQNQTSKDDEKKPNIQSNSPNSKNANSNSPNSKMEENQQGFSWKLRRRTSETLKEEKIIQTKEEVDVNDDEIITESPEASKTHSVISKSNEVPPVHQIVVPTHEILMKRALKMLQTSHELSYDHDSSLYEDGIQNSLEVEIREQLKIIEESKNAILASQAKPKRWKNYCNPCDQENKIQIFKIWNRNRKQTTDRNVGSSGEKKEDKKE